MIAFSVRVQVFRAEGCEFESQPSKTNDFQNWYLLLDSLTLGIGGSLSARLMWQWDIRSWYHRLGLLVGQYYKVTMKARCHKLVPILNWP